MKGNRGSVSVKSENRDPRIRAKLAREALKKAEESGGTCQGGQNDTEKPCEGQANAISKSTTRKIDNSDRQLNALPVTSTASHVEPLAPVQYNGSYADEYVGYYCPTEYYPHNAWRGNGQANSGAFNSWNYNQGIYEHWPPSGNNHIDQYGPRLFTRQ